MPTLSDNNIAIKVNELSKTYSIKNDKGREGIIYALNNVSFEINKGEVIGIIGPNGSGKSTLLKVISEITAPTSGSVEICGHVASILEVGTGFNPDLSGRKNIYLNARLHGMKKAEVDAKFNDIVELFGFPDFLDTPVKQYSSGMYMRLAFAVVVHIDADIYLFDEVLSVGDVEFRKRTVAVLKNLSPKTILIVTHSPEQLLSVVDRFVYLNNGIIEKSKDIEDKIYDIFFKRYTSSIKNKHFYNNKEENVIQWIKKTDDLGSIVPINARLIIQKDRNEIEVVFNYVLNSDNKIKNTLIIKDNRNSPLAQINFTNEIWDGDKCQTSVLLNQSLFGHYSFHFDILCQSKNEILLLPQILSHTFTNNRKNIGVLDLDYFIQFNKTI